MTPASPTPAASGRIIELDSIRGLAAIAVLVTHLPRGFWFGETGVDLFFVLSGYLITSIILRYREQPGFLRAFYYRRALRIFPIYYLAILAVLAVNALRHAPGSTEGIGYFFFYAQNIQYYWGGDPPSPVLPLGHTWTLAIEEQFYLLWPAIVVFLRPRLAFWVCATLVVLPVVLRAQGLDRISLLGHTDGLALGACLAFLGVRTRRAFTPAVAPAYLLAAVAAFVGYAWYWDGLSARGATGKQMVQDTYAISLVSLGYAAVVAFTLSLSGSRWGRVFRLRPLVWVGTVSYGLYLYHWILYDWIDTKVKFGLGYGDPWWLDVIKVTVSFAAAALSWYLIERPLLKLKDAVSYRGEKKGRAEKTPGTAALELQPARAR